MENNMPPVQPEQSVQETKVAAKAPGFNRLLIPVFLVVILILSGIIIFLLVRPGQNSPEKTPAPQLTESIKPTSIILDTSWKPYTDNEAGFTLKYPDSVLLDTKVEEATQSVLLISVQKLSSIPQDLPQLMGRKDALLEKEQLLKNEVENKVKIGSLNGKLGMTLASFEICSVILTRSLTFYPGDYRVIISLAGPKNAIMNSMPEFFTVDTANCGSKRIWNQDNISAFRQTLDQKKGQGAGQDWYDTFTAIVDTITLTTPSTAALSNLSVYKNQKYDFEISFPKSFRALDGKEDLYGYPNGIVLLYSGGQAYDIVVELWNNEADYKNIYASRINDITVINYDDKFITLLDNTSLQENKEIISSFKLSP